MRCRRCGGELGLDGRCEDCGALAAEVLTEREDPGAAYEEVPVHVMTDRERISYRGVTIEEGEPERPDVRFERSRRGWSGMIYTTPGDSWQSKLILYAGGALLLLFVFFVALPMAAAFVIFGALSWFVYRLLH